MSRELADESKVHAPVPKAERYSEVRYINIQRYIYIYMRIYMKYEISISSEISMKVRY